MIAGRYRSKGFYEFDIVERGKPRHIRSVHISERVVQRCLCDYCLVPMLSRSFIYDNGASLRGKGYDFAVSRVTHFLAEHYRKHGREGYVLVFDFSKYFDTAQHEPVFREFERSGIDDRLVTLSKYFIQNFGDVGLGLGSQVSQRSSSTTRPHLSASSFSRHGRTARRTPPKQEYSTAESSIVAYKRTRHKATGLRRSPPLFGAE